MILVGTPPEGPRSFLSVRRRKNGIHLFTEKRMGKGGPEIGDDGHSRNDGSEPTPCNVVRL